jgi:hypothetical protein
MSSRTSPIDPDLAADPPVAPRRDRAFAWLWASDSLSVFGGEFTLLALPLIAATWLHASASQMGALVAMEMLPFGLFSLPAGAIIDRCRKLPLLRAAAFGRAALISCVPLLAGHGALSIEALCAVAFLISCLSVFVDPAYQALLPQLVPRDSLVKANARLGLTQSFAVIAAPGLAGWLVQTSSAPIVILVDAVVIGIAGITLGRIGPIERRPEPPVRATPMRREILEGLALVWREPLLRSTCFLLAAWQLLKHVFVAVFVLYAVRELRLPADQIGLASAAAGVGFCVASLSVKRSCETLGLGATMLAGLLVATLCWGAVACTRGGDSRASTMLVLSMMGEGLGTGLFCLAFVSLRQAITPPHCLARVITSMRFLTISATPLGAWAGGLLGESIGLRETIACAAIAGVSVTLAAAWGSSLGRARCAAA